MNRLVHDFFKQFNLFSEEEIDRLATLFERRTINKNETFLNEGEKSKEIAFVETGIFRTYLVSYEGKEFTYCFRFPNDLLASYSSIILDQPSSETIEAITNASILVVKKRELDEFGNNHHNWTTFLKIIAEQEFLNIESKFFEFQKDNALQRYNTLLKKHPNYIQEIPLYYLASYLGITQRHLSRIRNNISF